MLRVGLRSAASGLTHIVTSATGAHLTVTDSELRGFVEADDIYAGSPETQRAALRAKALSATAPVEPSPASFSQEPPQWAKDLLSAIEGLKQGEAVTSPSRSNPLPGQS